MEYDRYQQNHSLFIIAMISLLLSMALIAFSFYIAPALLWNIHYDIPLFVINWREILHLDHGFTEKGSAMLVFLVFFIPACFAGFLAYFTSNRLENQVYHIEPITEDPLIAEERREDLKESTSLSLKIFFLIMVVVVISLTLPWLFSTTLNNQPPTPVIIDTGS